MKNVKKMVLMVGSVMGLALLVAVSLYSGGQELAQRETYQAQAMGQSTQLGKTFNVTVIIEEYSSPEERQVLIDAFEKAGSQGMYEALEKMHAKGRIAITGTLGYDISFVRQVPMPNGRKIRILTNRPITFGEAWTSARSKDYNLSGMELDLSSEKDKSTGTLLPACKFSIDKKTKELTIEAFKNPWKLVNIMDRSKDTKE